MDDLALTPGNPKDVPFIMRTERLPGYDELVVRWSEDHHPAAVEDTRHAYFEARCMHLPVGFGPVLACNS
ncbi:hypothetical protein WDZ92_54105, partial [Nostoc sp. NIES-2111]